MLSFIRNKVVGIEQPRQDILQAHGVLDDNVYGMELDVEVKLPEMAITRIEGKYRRFTNSECPKAIPILQNAVGMCLFEQDFSRKVHRLVGKAGCTHFANLLLECCDSVVQAALYGDWQVSKENSPELTRDEYLKDKLRSIPGAQNMCLTFPAVVDLE
jgi:hypothetical protein